MSHLRRTLGDRRVGFLVCSNTALEARTFVTLETLLGLGHPLEDMYSFARCDYLVGPPSTFTMWASFYGKVPLYPMRDAETMPALEHFVCEFA
jgi:hypothetical protein